MKKVGFKKVKTQNFTKLKINSSTLKKSTGLNKKLLAKKKNFFLKIKVQTRLQYTKKKIRFLKKINNLRGNRHKLFLPTRGQTTKTNAKTQKKKRTHHNFILKKKNAKKNKNKKK